MKAHTAFAGARVCSVRCAQLWIRAFFSMQVKLNTDDSPGVATEYGIRSIPTIMLFKGGKRLDTIIGAVPKENLMKTITKITS